MNNNLKKLLNPTNEICENTQQLIESWINTSKIGNTYTLNIDLQNFDNIKRIATLTKTSRVKTILRIVGFQDDKKYTEYAKQYSKITSNVTENAKDIAQILNTFKLA